ncbi:E3 ubiquitin-protein ligase RNF168-like [Arvicola amphibius]|uniref:E3 ubiquitin-protein ligase RNF168-like n=1 Tax=Arvicola amphibius TaxID=1047088 RepID=UPI0018E2E712|nr:E3 ubiquitin-protein ligase RNF168-like [Arvicola amphibius]
MALSKDKALSLDDCQCLLCLEFLIEPITLPCKHTMCKSCFKAILQTLFSSCPFCRTPVSSWAGDHTQIDRLINEELWKRIQETYADECRRRDPGEEQPPWVFRAALPAQVLSNPGELRKEYEEEIMRMEAERQATMERQTRASEEYIKQLLAEDMQEEKLWAEKRRLEEQGQREEEAKKLSMGDTATSPRKKKRKLKHCDSVPQHSLLQSQLESASQYDAVQDGKKIPVKTDSDGKSRMGQKMKTKENMPAATGSRGPETPNQGTINALRALFYDYDVKVGTSEYDGAKPSCSKHLFDVPLKTIRLEEATADSSSETESASSVSGKSEEIGNSTAEAKDTMSHPSSSKHTNKRKHQESSPEAAGEPGTYLEMSPKSSLEEEETEDFIIKRLIELEHLYFERRQQEEQDRKFALELQKALDKEWREMQGDCNAFPPDTSAKGEVSKDKDI